MRSVDFSVFVETRESPSRRQLLDGLFPSCAIFSSGISQHTGGIAVVVKESFLKRFSHQQWQILVPGRVGILHLDGNEGSISIVAVYLDPSSKQSQRKHRELISWVLDSSRHLVIAGDFNFVTSEHDRISKNDGAIKGSSEVVPELGSGVVPRLDDLRVLILVLQGRPRLFQYQQSCCAMLRHLLPRD